MGPDATILISNTPYLENYDITHYLGFVTEHTVLDYSTLSGNLQEEDAHHDADLKEEKETPLKLSPGPIYENLANKLKPHARKVKGNAVINIQ